MSGALLAKTAIVRRRRRTVARHRTAVVRRLELLTERDYLARVVEALIARIDEIDGDPDLEDSGDGEPDDDDLGASEDEIPARLLHPVTWA